jgi:phosphate acetyltransferase
MNLLDRIWAKAKQNRKIIVLPEGEEERTIVASAKVLKEEVASLILIGDENIIKDKASKLGINIDKAKIINPKTSDKRDEYIQKLYELRKHKGMTLEEASKLILDNVYFGTMLVKTGEADGMVSGAIHTSSELLRPALQIIKTSPTASLVSSFFIIVAQNCEYGETFLFADCGLNINPTAEELADIAIQTATTAINLCDMDPQIALLSFSTKGSAEDVSVDKVRMACQLIKEKRPDLPVDGELQLDAAIVPDVALRKAPGSKVAGYANILIFPDINAGNIGYKLTERFGKAQAIGPLCQGFAKPVNDLSRGCSADDIAMSIAVTVVQAQLNNN